MKLLFAAAIFLGAALMFWIELLVGRLVLPALGGSAAVWNTCMFFFQAVLLVGYGYAHLSTKLRPRVALALHAAVLMLPWLILPVALPAEWTPDPRRPITELLGWLVFAPGLPLLAVAAGAPLLQSWYARLGRTDSADPYWLYAASNLGSLIGLLGYPFALEPLLGLSRQAMLWSVGYGLLVLTTLLCGVAFARLRAGIVPTEAETAAATETTETETAGVSATAEGTPVVVGLDDTPPNARTIARWVLLSFVPGCLLYGVTTALTIDVAPVPLLWVVPLALYLASFVVAFGPGERLPRNVLAAGLAAATVLMLVTRVIAFSQLLWVVLGLHLVGFFGLAIVLHGDLARTRPAARHLTAYYLWIAAGGALAGAYCGLVAPLVFPDLLEYPFALLLALVLLPDAEQADRGLRPPGAARVILWGVFASVGILVPLLGAGFTTHDLGAGLLALLTLLPCAIVLALAWPAGRWRALMVLGIGFGCSQVNYSGQLLHRERSFYGLHRVVDDQDMRAYLSGRVVHGRQPKALERRREPVSYYYRGGPIGSVVAAHATRPRVRIAVLGLGIGGLAGYARPRQTWRFYEIDPAVERIAREERWFTYLADSPAETKVVLGDARLSLQAEIRADEPRWNLIVVDTFTSDSVPIHLLTREAVRVYLDRLTPGGALLFNASNHYVELAPLFAALAAELDLVGRQRVSIVDAEGRKLGHSSTVGVVLARAEADLGPLLTDPRWKTLAGERKVRVWTDDHADLLELIKR